MWKVSVFLAELLDCPLVVFSPSSAPHHVSRGLGGWSEPGLRPLPSASLLEPMSMVERLQNWCLHLTSLAMMDWLGSRVQLQQEKLLQRSLPPLQVGCSSPSTLYRVSWRRA